MQQMCNEENKQLFVAFSCRRRNLDLANGSIFIVNTRNNQNNIPAKGRSVFLKMTKVKRF